MKRGLWLGLWPLLLLLFTACPRTLGPPEVVATDPAAGAQGVRLDRAYTATFSAPLDPQSLAGAIEVRVGGAALGFTAGLQSGNRVLSIRFTEDPKTLPAEVEIRLSEALLGQDGRPIVPYTWRFTLADWVPLEAGLGAPSPSDFDLAGTPLAVAWTEPQQGGGSQGFARLWDPSSYAWQPLGDHLPRETSKTSVALCADAAGNLHAFWLLATGAVETARFRGGAWETPTSLMQNASWLGSAPVCGRRPPLSAAWTEIRNDGSGRALYAARWTGSGWHAPPPFYQGANEVYTSDAAATDTRLYAASYGFDSSGGHYVDAQVREWNGSTWSDLGGALDGDHDPQTKARWPRLAILGGKLYAGWIEGWVGSERAYVAFWDGSTWRALPSPGPAKALDLAGGEAPLVVLADLKGQVRVLAYDPNAGGWSALGGSPGSTGTAPPFGLIPRIALTARGTPVVAFAGAGGLRVYRFNRINP